MRSQPISRRLGALALSLALLSSIFVMIGVSATTGIAGATGTSILTAGQTLSEGDYLVNGSYALYMQPDGNLVLYENWGGPGNVGTPIWATMTFNWQHNNQPLTLHMQSDGNLVLYAGFVNTGNIGTPVWATMQFGSNAYLDLQTDRNLVVYAATGYTWASWTQLPPPPPPPPPPPAAIPSSLSVLGTGQTLTEGNYLVNGTYAMYMQPDGNLVVYANWQGPSNVGRPLWASMTFNRQHNNQSLTLWMQPDGNLVLYAGFVNTGNIGTAVWATMKFGPSSYLSMQTDGNLVTYSDPGYPSNPLGAYTWATMTFGNGIPQTVGVYDYPSASQAISDGWHSIADTGALGTTTRPYVNKANPAALRASATVKQNTSGWAPWLSFWTVSGPVNGDTFYQAGYYAGVSVAGQLNSANLATLPNYEILDPEGYPDANSGLGTGSITASANNWQQMLAGWAAGLATGGSGMHPGFYPNQSEYNAFNLASIQMPAFLAVAFGANGSPPVRIIGSSPNVQGVIAWGSICSQGLYEANNLASWGYSYNTLQFPNGTTCNPS